VAAGFAAPAFLVSRGFTVAGDRQKESTADTLSISAAQVQQQQKQQQQQ